MIPLTTLQNWIDRTQAGRGLTMHETRQAVETLALLHNSLPFIIAAVRAYRVSAYTALPGDPPERQAAYDAREGIHRNQQANALRALGDGQ